MVRTQLQLPEEQARALRELAAERGVSVAELIREAVEQMLRECHNDELWRRASSLIGRYRDDATDASVNHDAYLDEAYC
jgi:hypothetical protein